MPQTKVTDATNGVHLLMDGYGREVIQNILHESQTAYNDTMKHRINYQRYFKKRFGIRPSITTWPWRNAANLHLPLIDKTIRRSKPKFIRLVEAVNPIVTLKSNLIGDDLGTVRGVERKFDEQLRDKMRIVEKIALGSDKMLERGYFLGKVVQEFTPVEVNEVFYLDRLPDSWKEFIADTKTTDDMLGYAIANRFEMDVNDKAINEEIRTIVQKIRSGVNIIRFKRTVDTTEFPSLYIRDPLKVIVPYDTTDIQVSRLITDKMTMTERDIQAKGESNVWDKENVYDYLNRYSDANGGRDKTNYTGDRNQEYVETLENIREGVYPSGHLPCVDEHYTFFKWPGDILPSPSVLTCAPGHPEIPFRFIKYPYVDEYGRPDVWPFGKVEFEIVSERFHSSRGVPQMLDSLQTEVTNNHNAKQNHMTIATSLNIKAKRNANVSTQWVPGQPMWMNRLEDVDVMQIGAKDVSFDNEEKTLLGWADAYMGLVDDPLKNGGPTQEPRTQAEIEKLSDIEDDVAYGDVVIYQIGMNKIYGMAWRRWMQYGPSTIQIQTPAGEFITVEKEELTRRFRLTPTGNLGNSSVTKRKKDARQRFAMYNNDPYINQHELRRQALMYDDERVCETLLLSNSQMQQNEIERQIQEIAMMGMGYTSVPKLSDDHDSHIKTIDDFMQDPKKIRTIQPDRLEAIMNHRQAHILAKNRKQRATTKNDRLQQEVGNVANGKFGRAARNSVDAGHLTEASA